MNNDEKNTKPNQDDSNNNPKQEPNIREEDIIKTEPIRINESLSREDRNISGRKDQPVNNSSKDKE